MSNDQRILRNALGSFATGVTVVTTRAADVVVRPHDLAAYDALHTDTDDDDQ